MGHLRFAASPVVATIASATASPASSGSHAGPSDGTGTVAETATDVPGGASQVRASRPRPSLWWSATTTRHGSPSHAARALVEPMVAWCSTSRHGSPA